MIKATIKKERRNEDFPKLMISDNGQVVFATEINKYDNDCFEGFVVCRGESVNKIGEFADCWSCDLFEHYSGEVILKNE